MHSFDKIMRLKTSFQNFLKAALLLAVSACTSVTEEDRSVVTQIPPNSVEAPDSNSHKNSTAQLELFRKWNGEGLLFLGTGPMVLLDGQEIGRCLLGDGSKIRIPAGEHVIRARTSDVSERRFRIDPGQTAFIECRYTVGVMSPNVEFVFLDKRG